MTVKRIVKAPSKSAPKTPPAVDHSASNARIGAALANKKNTLKVAAVEVVAAPVPVEGGKLVVINKPKRAVVPRIEHPVTSQYAGPSLGLNKRKSTTALDLATFGTKPDYVLTERTTAVGKALRAKYGSTPFARANADAGIMKYLGIKGFIEHVEGNPASEAAMFRFTSEGLKHLPA